ncbi:ERF family protein [Aquabacterium sp.]|uniref:ERF family protein n=1 Tax=Aquabacterium sp. TaxID=1872578 RepID=UPI0035AE3A41
MNEVIESPSQPLQAPVAVRQSDSAALIQAITAAANNPQTDIEKMERLWAMHERIAARDAEQAFNDAMTSAQSEMGRVSADATNNQTRSKYATYGQLDKHLRPIYTKHGFSLSFDTADGAPDGHLRVLAYTSHKSGHTRTYRADVPNDGKGAKGGDVMTKTHAAGSAMSYGMRYLLKMIFNVAIGEDDDDGNSAGVDAVTQVAAENIAAKMLATFHEQLAKTTTDEAAAALWATAGKALLATGDKRAYTTFRDEVVAHRTAMRDRGAGNA